MLDSRISQKKIVGPLNIYFAFSSSIIGSLGMAATTKKLINVDDIKFSVFGGIIQIGIIGNFIIDPFISTIVGLISGLFSNLFFNIFFYKLKNKNFL